MKTNRSLDRWMAFFFVILLVVVGVMGFNAIAGFWNEVLWLIWIAILARWGWRGRKNVPVGWMGQLLFLGGRLKSFFDEGKHWAPWPFGIQTEDCREVVLELDPVRAITTDNVEVEAQVTITRAVINLHSYLDVEPSGIRQWLDDVRDEVFRTEVSSQPLESVLKMGAELREKLHQALQGKDHWGIRITAVAFSKIRATDPKVQEDLALKEREGLQREGQKVELKHFADRVQELMIGLPDGPGLSREQAVEQVQLSLGHATKAIDTKNISLDPTMTAAIVAVVGRRS